LHENSRIRKTSPRDFKKLNKMSLKDGGVNARDQYSFRQSHDARIPYALGHADKSIKMPEERFTYGQQTRPQTPFKGIISGNYGTEAARDITMRYDYQKELVSGFLVTWLFSVQAAKDADTGSKCDPHDPRADGHGRVR